MTGRSRVTLATVAALAALVASAGAQGTAPAPARPAPATTASPAVATVGGERIATDELDRHFREALQLYRSRNGTAIDPQLEPAVRRQVLENLIRQRLLALEARRRGISVSDADAEAELRKDPVFQQGGAFSEVRYQALKTTNPTAYAKSIAAIKTNLASRRAGLQMDRDVRPDPAAIRTRLEHELATVSLEYLALRANEFDGGIREPRESEVLEYYRTHGESYRRPEQAHLSVFLVNRPPLADSAGATDAGFRAWETAMRARADSARAAIRAGARFEDLAALYGGARSEQILRRDRSPDFWRGGPRELAAAIAAAPGTVLPEPVRAASGWAIVRVDRVQPSRIAPLREVARDVRSRLRATARTAVEDRELKAAYDALGDSLRGDAWRLRYAFADTATFAPGEPTEQDLERFYRLHLADYSSYDRASAQVVETPLVRVRDDVRMRWMRDRRTELARNAAERLREAWSRGRQDAALEKSMTLTRNPGLVPVSVPPAEGPLGAAIAEALARRGDEVGSVTIPVPGGFAVIHVSERVRNHMPTFEQARPLLQTRREAFTIKALEDDARPVYERDSTAFMTPATIHFSRMVIEPPNVMQVPLTRAEVERYFRANLTGYTVQELARVRHILISPERPGAAADDAARRKAEDLLKRIRAGEDFSRLAAEFSDDPATRNEGGDVGMFRRGQMREGFERAAFAMRPADITGPVKTEVGYHIIECLEYLPPVIHTLAEVYANVAYDCALEKANRIAGERADSLLRTIKSIAQAKEVAKRHGLNIIPTDHVLGTLSSYGPDLRPYIAKLEALKPGQIHPAVQEYTGHGTVITWVDGISQPRQRPWIEARPYVVQRQRAERARASLAAKRSELDSLMAHGWSFDSLTALWGGPERIPEAEVGGELRGLGGRTLLDSLVFGRDHPPVLAAGTLSEWIQFPGGLARLRVTDRITPDPDELARRAELRSQVVMWRRLNDYFDTLRSRYPVRILDGELRAIALPEPAEES